MGGYICDKCRKVIFYPGTIYYTLTKMLSEHPNSIFRIFCKECGEIVERAEHTMKLEGSKVRDGT